MKNKKSVAWMEKTSMRSYLKHLINILLLVVGCWLLVAGVANASALFFNPQDGIEVEEGESIVVEARLDTEGNSINAIDALMHFSPQAFEVADVSRGDSAITLWITEPLIDNANGTVRFMGGIPLGASFTSGLIAKITLQARAVGESMLGWDRASQILLNDGRGTKDELEVLETSAKVTPALTDVPRISSSSHENQSKWYKGTTLVVSWIPAKEALYSYVLDHDSRSVPDTLADTPQGELRFDGSLKYEGLTEGVYYFHLREGVKEPDVVRWSRTRTFRAQIDTTPPNALSAQIGSDPSLYEGKFFVSFSGSDTLSGTDRYDVWEVSGDWTERAISPHKLLGQETDAPIKVRVLDKAGNQREILVSYPPKPGKEPMTLYEIIGGVVVLAALLIAGWIWRYRRKRSKL
ncbi:MAG: hypothetical protein Q7S09_05040 [bacterium]|nr:hypothetical protein [bacterium]